MSDQAEKTCPLCAEEMDLTDQQLKPCKCGYEICIWCWHHIMDMAENETKGRCPACRTLYNKEKIVEMASKCERLVAEMHMEKKMKSQKPKSKAFDGRKQLTNVRVIQRNLAYIVGLPLNLADEDLLQRREYFSQYGKVLKVSISRTSAGTIQQFANNTCSVYITYTEEEEAVRCIQSVHSFVLDGRSLRACFGTTKYCHAWLRNLPCNSSDCLYLHEIGSQEDSFTKDEVVSECMRGRVQQITGATNSMQRRSGDMLPPPADEYYINSSVSSGKSLSKSASHNPVSSVSGSPLSSNSGLSVDLPGATFWGVRALNNQPPSGNLACSTGPSNQKHETCNGSIAFSTEVGRTIQVPPSYVDVEKKHISKGECRTTASEAPATPGVPATRTVDVQLHSPGLLKDKDLDISANGNIQSVCSDMGLLHVERRLGDDVHFEDSTLNGLLSENTVINSPQKDQGFQQHYSELFRAPSRSITLAKDLSSADNICTSREPDSLTREQSGWRLDSRTQVGKRDSHVAFPEVEEDLHYFEDQRRGTSYLPNLPHSFLPSCQSSVHSSQQNDPYCSISFNRDPQILDNKVDTGLLMYSSDVPKVPNGYSDDMISKYIGSDRELGHPNLLPSEVKKIILDRVGSQPSDAGHNVASDFGERNIISDILSIEFDDWDASLTSPQNLVKLLGDNNRLEPSLKLSSSWKVQNSSQSRFSFAREDESKNEVSDVGPLLHNSRRAMNDHASGFEFSENSNSNIDKHGDFNGLSAFTIGESKNFAGSCSYLSSNKLSVSRVQVSAPPGFTGLSKEPPPGFSCNETTESAFHAMPWNGFVDTSSLRNPYEAPPTGHIGRGDFEYMDPAILAVGTGRLPSGLNNASSSDMRSIYSSQLSSAFENEARLQLLMQRSLSPLQNQRFNDFWGGFAPHSDAYRIPSRIMKPTLASNPSPLSQLNFQQSRSAAMSNGQWDGWNEAHGWK